MWYASRRMALYSPDNTGYGESLTASRDHDGKIIVSVSRQWGYLIFFLCDARAENPSSSRLEAVVGLLARVCCRLHLGRALPH